MKFRRYARLLFFLGLVFAGSSRGLSGDNLQFIINAENPASSLTREQVRSFYLKRQREWPDGTMVRFIDFKPSAERNIFLKNFVRKTEEELGRYWIGEKLQSGNSAPTQSPSDANTIQFVAAFQGAMGYVAPSTGIDNKKVKVIPISD